MSSHSKFAVRTFVHFVKKECQEKSWQQKCLDWFLCKKKLKKIKLLSFLTCEKTAEK